MNPYSRTSAVRVVRWCGAAFLLLFVGFLGGYFYILSMIQDIKNVEDKLTEISGLNVSLRSPSLSYQDFNPTFFFPNVDITIANHSNRKACK